MADTKQTGHAIGLKGVRGFIVTKRTPELRPSRRRGVQSVRVKLIRGVIREVAGWAPYEKRLMEILKGGGANPQKRAWKFAKRRLGTHVRAKRKVSEMQDQIAIQAKVLSAAIAQKKAAKAAKEAAAAEKKA